MKYFKLNDGNRIPANGFGTFRIPDNEQCAKAVRDAINTGYRLIDTAEGYHNEDMVGKGIKEADVSRDQLFITSKLWLSHHGYQETKQAIDDSLNQIGLDYMDLFLIHQPLGDYYGSWRAMEDAQKAGKIKSIGLSNFSPRQVADLANFNDVKPAVIQTEVNPWQQKKNDMTSFKSFDVQPESWASFAEGRNDIFHNPVLTKIAKDHHKNVGQVVLRWLFQRHIVSLAKSVHADRIKGNLDIYDFSLTDVEMKKISGLDRQSGIQESMSGDLYSDKPENVRKYTDFIHTLSKFD